MIKYLLLVFISLPVQADIMEDFDSLGGNKSLLEAAKALRPDTDVKVVQKRIVNRHKRSEISSEMVHVSQGGNPYFQTNGAGLSYNFHINPRWSVGARYTYYFNELAREGKELIERAKIEADANNKKDIVDREDQAFVPELNWPEESYMAMVSWYPVYGKMNLLDRGVAHFDVYTTLGIGETKLRFNESNIYEAAVGMGIWWSQHLSTRIEAKYNTYEAAYFDETRDVNTSALSLSMGYLL